MRGGKMRVGEKQRKMPALSPRRMRLTEDASRESMSPFGGGSGKPLPVTSLNLGIGKQKRSKRND